jgi:DNA-binding CsgD family transcriptional regulator
MHYRPVRIGDLEACAALVPPIAGVAPGAPALAALWRELLREERISGGVVVEATAPDRVLAFGLMAFVEEGVLASYLAAPRPYLSASLYEAVRSRRSLLLGPLDVRQGNEAGTLNFVILHFRLAPGLEPSVEQGAVAAAEAAFRLAHGGYRIRRVLQEAYGPYERAMLTSAGLRLKSDYSEYFAASCGAQPPADQRPALMGLYADDDAESRLLGTAAASLFHFSEPRFYFSPGEQRMLARAVLDESDEEIACELGISVAAVKKVWRRVYERVADKDPALLDVDANGSGSTRGKEKRRVLLRYLRNQLHELRPIVRRGPD